MTQPNQPMNVYETWPLIDTVLIGKHPTIQKVEGWLQSYADLGNLRDVPFFNIRNRSSAGVAYNNFDSKEHLSFVYHCYSFGVQFFAPVNGGIDAQTGEPGDTITQQLFAAELIKHASVELKVSQDQKLENVVMLTPDGSGAGGLQIGGGGPGYTQSQSYGNGENVLTNRWRFAEPIQMPRNVTLQAKVIFSEYAREMLKVMFGPGTMTVDPNGLVQFPSVAGIRLSMFGKREVQQRGQLHFS